LGAHPGGYEIFGHRETSLSYGLAFQPLDRKQWKSRYEHAKKTGAANFDHTGSHYSSIGRTGHQVTEQNVPTLIELPGERVVSGSKWAHVSLVSPKMNEKLWT
jgi:hypothetical protein